MVSLKFYRVPEVKMAFCQSLRLYGSAAACSHARALLENLPEVHRIDGNGAELRLFLIAPLSEGQCLSLLEKSGISGFSFLR